MEERRTESISRQAWRIYGVQPGKIVGLLALVFAVLLLSIGIGLLINGFFVLLFLLFGVPAVFAAFLLLFSLKNEGDETLLHFPKAYAAYFVSPFRGVLRATVSFFKSLLVFFVTVIAVLFFYYFLSPNFDPAFQETLKELVVAYEYQDFTTFADMLSGNSSIILFYQVLYPVTFGISGLFLFHFLFLGAIEVSGRANVPQVVAEGTTVRVFSNAARRIRKSKALEYWKACWFLPIVYLASFGLGVFLGNKITTTNAMISLVIGFAVACLVYLLFLPYHAELHRLFMNAWEKEIYTSAVKMMRELLVQATAAHSLDEKGSAFFLKRVERLEKALEEGNYREIKGEEDPDNPYE